MNRSTDKKKLFVDAKKKGYRRSYIEEGQAMQWSNEKGQNGLQNTIQKTED